VSKRHNCQSENQKLQAFLWSLLNKSMKNTETATQKWIRDNGMLVASFNTTHVRLLKAQQTAHWILSQHRSLLNAGQIALLERFQKQMANKRIRSRLKPQAAKPVLNIGSKINRQLFRQHRQLEQA
jgi:hypothetical protein